MAILQDSHNNQRLSDTNSRSASNHLMKDLILQRFFHSLAISEHDCLGAKYAMIEHLNYSREYFTRSIEKRKSLL